jgi:hypothetical protein
LEQNVFFYFQQGITLTLAFTNLQRLAKIITKTTKVENHIEEAGNFFSQKRDFAEFRKILMFSESVFLEGI